jgi:hypothetical protein
LRWRQQIETHGPASPAIIAHGPVFVGSRLDPTEASEAKKASAAIALGRAEPAEASGAEWVLPDGIAEGLLSFYTRLFVGRTEERRHIRSLATMKDPGYLLVRGTGGIGKSALLSNLVQELRETPAQPGNPALLYYFIRAGRTDPRRLFQSLNLQITRILQRQEDLETEESRLEKQFCRRKPVNTDRRFYFWTVLTNFLIRPAFAAGCRRIWQTTRILSRVYGQGSMSGDTFPGKAPLLGPTRGRYRTSPETRSKKFCA